MENLLIGNPPNEANNCAIRLMEFYSVDLATIRLAYFSLRPGSTQPAFT